MNPRKCLHGLTIFLILGLWGLPRQDGRPLPRGPYLGQEPPGNTPRVFAPRFVSTGLDELNSVFSPDGREFYFCVRNMRGAVSIFQMKMTGEVWSAPALLPFASSDGDIDVTMSPDGRHLFFCSRRPLPGEDHANEDYDFWMAARRGASWGEPVHLGAGINSPSHDFYPMASASGTIYFSSQREGPGTNNIYSSKRLEGGYGPAVKLGDAVNTEHREFDPYVSPDEHLLIFTSTRPGGYGGGDLYISFKDERDCWTPAENMGDRINSSGPEFCPQVSPDGRYLFFTSARKDDGRLEGKLWEYERFVRAQSEARNGFGDIYWVSAEIIQDVRTRVFR